MWKRINGFCVGWEDLAKAKALRPLADREQ